MPGVRIFPSARFDGRILVVIRGRSHVTREKRLGIMNFSAQLPGETSTVEDWLSLLLIFLLLLSPYGTIVGRLRRNFVPMVARTASDQ